MDKTNRFTREEIEFVKRNCFNMTSYKMSKILGRCPKSIGQRIKLFQLTEKEESGLPKDISTEKFIRHRQLVDNIEYLEKHNKNGKLDRLISINKNSLERLNKNCVKH